MRKPRKAKAYLLRVQGFGRTARTPRQGDQVETLPFPASLRETPPRSRDARLWGLENLVPSGRY